MSGVTEFIKDYGPSIPWVVAVVGWMVANQQANHREKRKEIRSDIEDICKLIEELLDHLKDALPKDGADEETVRLEQQVKLKFHRIDSAIERLGLRLSNEFNDWDENGLLDLSEVHLARENFFDIATGEYFEDVMRVPLSGQVYSFAWQKRFYAGHKLSDALHRAFLKVFK